MTSTKIAVALCVLAMFQACATSPPRVVEQPDRKIAVLGAPLRDGDWRWLYPDGAHVLAEGSVRKGRRVGEWTFYYHHNQQFAHGTFSGLFEGRWVLWKPDGTVSEERSGTCCEDFVLMWCPAGSDDFPWGFFSADQIESLRELLPQFSGGLWSGTGFYRRGARVRALTEAELPGEMFMISGS